MRKTPRFSRDPERASRVHHPTLLQRSLALRISLQRCSHQDPPHPHSLLNGALSLDNDFARWYRELPTGYFECQALGRDTTINIWRVHQILVQDVLIHYYYGMEKAMAQPACFDREVNQCMAKAHDNIDAILESAPYYSRTRDSSGWPNNATSVKGILYHLTYSYAIHARYRVMHAADEATDTHY